ncbi:GDP-mannose 4,6-dehydratase [Candidatus Pelagibacter sp.]|uniref:GDP-mannose 4,6-dehydratase n=1 Tax=Candidatus Pelagibacter sp. TaxID=2024849 RepID=UPI003F87C2CB
MKKTALITGISGQDGAYLAKFLLEKNYKVIGTDRRSARSVNWRLRRLGIENKIIYEEMELGEIYEIQRVFGKYKLNEVYNLAAQSFVGTSFSSPLNTANITGLGTLRILETIRSTDPKIKFYQASSSEMFGDVLEKKQKETTPLNPQSPYAIAKVFSHYLTQNYRNSYGMFATSGILFNHESPLRGEEFVTRKIIIGLIKILKKEINYFELGNLYAKRDWGYAKEYVEAMWKMLQMNKPDDYVISTGKTYSIKDFINKATKYLKMNVAWKGKGLKEKLIDLDKNQVIIKINPKYFRPAEVNILIGDSKKAQQKLKWKPNTNLDQLIQIMIDDELKYS